MPAIVHADDVCDVERLDQAVEGILHGIREPVLWSAVPTLVRIVAAAAAAWRTPAPPPLLAMGHVDVRVPPELMLFSGQQLRDFVASGDDPVPALSSCLGMTPPTAWEVDPAAEPRRTLLNEPQPAFLAAHGATGLRSLLPPAERTRSWICTQRVARWLWPDLPSYDLLNLAAHRRLHPAVSSRPEEWPFLTVAERALLTTLLLVELLEARSVNAMLALMGSSLPPLHPAPDLRDAVAWAQVPDDDLTWLSRLGGAPDAAAVRRRANDERERREREGWATPLLGMPPTLRC